MDHVPHRPQLDNASGIHHRNALGRLGNHAHVVRDQHHRRAARLREALEQRDDLGLDRHVERGGGLIGDDQLRLGGDGERDHDALAHAARELVRVVREARLRARDAHLGQELHRAAPRFRPAQIEVRLDGLDELLAHRIKRIQRGERVLEHHADLAAAHAAHLVLRQVVDAPSFQAHLAPGDAPGRLEQVDHRHAGEGLAGAGLADHPEDFARGDGERHAVHGHQRSAPGRKLDAQLVDFENHLSFGLSASRSQSPRRLTESTRMISAAPGNTVIHHSPE
jgi:hypothetical protein